MPPPDSHHRPAPPPRTRSAAIRVGVLTALAVACLLSVVVNYIVPAEGLPGRYQWLIGGGVWACALAVAAVEAWVYWPRDDRSA